MNKSQQSFRVTNRSALSTRAQKEDTAEVIRENKSRIDNMVRSNALLREELLVEQRVSKDNSRRTKEVVERLHEEGVAYARKIVEEVKKKELIAEQIAQCSEQLAENKKVLLNPNGDKNSALWRRIKEKEAELEKHLQNFNETHSSNKNLRMQINHLRKERSLYDKIYYNLEKDIMKKKEDLIALIREVRKKEEEKNKAQKELKAFKYQSDQELDAFKTQYKESLEGFKVAKDRYKTMRSVANLNTNRDDHGHGGMDSRLLSTDQKVHKVSSQNKGNEQGGLNRMDREMLDQLAAFFSTLFEETQMTDVDEIISAIKKADTEEETINDQITDTNKEIEELEQAIADEKKRMSGLKQLTPEEMDKLREAERLEDQIQKNEELMKNYDKKMAGIANNLKCFKVVSDKQEGLPPILDLLEIGEESRKLDDQGQLQINEHSITYLMEILGEVEKRVDELYYVCRQLKQTDDPSKVINPNPARVSLSYRGSIRYGKTAPYW